MPASFLTFNVPRVFRISVGQEKRETSGGIGEIEGGDGVRAGVEFDDACGSFGGRSASVGGSPIDDTEVREIAVSVGRRLRQEDHVVGAEREDDEDAVADDDRDDRVEH